MMSYKAFLRIYSAITTSITWSKRNFSAVHRTQHGDPVLVVSTVFLKFIVWLQLLSSGQTAREHKETKPSAGCKRRKKNSDMGLLFLTDVFGDLQCLLVWLVSATAGHFFIHFSLLFVSCTVSYFWSASPLALQKCITQAEMLPLPSQSRENTDEWRNVGMGMGTILAGLMNSLGLERIDGSCESWFTATSPVSLPCYKTHHGIVFYSFCLC